MISMSGKSAAELCSEYAKYRTIKEANEQMAQSIMDDINDALFAIDPQAGYAFTKALAKDESADPGEFFGVSDAPRRRKS